MTMGDWIRCVQINNIPFYVKQGFEKYEKTVKNFFIDNYEEKITKLKAIELFETGKLEEIENKITERKIRLAWDVPDLELKIYKNGNKEQIRFIYDLKKEVYQKYVENIYGEWNEEIQKKLFDKFMKENSKNIELIYLKDKLVQILQRKRNKG